MATPAEDHDAVRKSEYVVRRSGRPYTADYRVYFERAKDKRPVSPFHDMPLYHDKEGGILNMVVEVPRFSNAKFETYKIQISRNERLNPIHQDTHQHGKHQTPRFVKNCFPYKGYLWNYGALPQTWEDPSYRSPDTGGARGDNDPLDACEIGRSVARAGDVKQVKVLGVLGVLDGGETDWKVLVIDVRDPLAGKVQDVEDVERHCPGLLDATRDWFRIYKVPDGEPGNHFAFGGRWKGREYAEGVIRECRRAWKRLVKGRAEKGDISIDNTTLKGTPGKLDPEKVHLPRDEHLTPAPIKEDVDEYFFIDRDAIDEGKTVLEKTNNLRIELDMR